MIDLGEELISNQCFTATAFIHFEKSYFFQVREPFAHQDVSAILRLNHPDNFLHKARPPCPYRKSLHCFAMAIFIII